MRTSLCVVVFQIVLMSVSVAAGHAVQEKPRERRELSRGQTVILGAYSWDIETNSQRGPARMGVWWEQVRAGVLVAERVSFPLKSGPEMTPEVSQRRATASAGVPRAVRSSVRLITASPSSIIAATVGAR